MHVNTRVDVYTVSLKLSRLETGSIGIVSVDGNDTTFLVTDKWLQSIHLEGWCNRAEASHALSPLHRVDWTAITVQKGYRWRCRVELSSLENILRVYVGLHNPLGRVVLINPFHIRTLPC